MAKLSEDKQYVVVERGDTLSQIALDYLGSVGKTSLLAAINNIDNPDLIYVGEIIYLYKQGGASTESSSQNNASNSNRAVITRLGLQSDTDSTLFATWSWSRRKTAHYEVEWKYLTDDGVWFIGDRSTTEDKQSTYTMPANARTVGVSVRPVSETYSANGNEISHWTAGWSVVKSYSYSKLPPITPPTPTVEIDGFKLTASIDNIDKEELRADCIQFQVVKDNSSVVKVGKSLINSSLNYVSYQVIVPAGSEFKVRCRSVRGSEYSEWSDYSTSVQTKPAPPSGITTCKATSKTSIYLAWAIVSSAKSYDVEYATKREYFDRTDQTTTKTGIESTRFEFVGLETGQEYFFRVRAVNDKGHSAWTSIKSVIIGKDPAAPTTWSSTTTAVTGEELTLYWVHNSEDNSSQTYAELELTIGGTTTVHTIQNTTDEDTKDLTSHYSVDTSACTEGTFITWRVRTAGITKVYGEWSVHRTIDIYSPPTLELSVTDFTGREVETLGMFPLYIRTSAGPNTQMAIGHHLTITSNEIYETVDNIGNAKTVNKGEEVYSKHFDTPGNLSAVLTSGNIDLENNISYTITCTVSMNSGLTAESSMEFVVEWSEESFTPNAEITVDEDTLAAHIRPYCEETIFQYRKVAKDQSVFTVTDEVVGGVYGTPIINVATTTGEQVYYGTFDDDTTGYYCEVMTSSLVNGVTLSVYRREFDGGFTKIAEGIDNMRNTFVTDPHPALDYARYRIVATTKSTGAVSYYDAPGYPINEKAVVIQWDEEWTSFETTEETVLEQPAWSGSMLKLPYNIDISDDHKSDVSLVEYIGRKRPVSYYGTQLGETAKWKVDIPKSDKETLYALRRLATWMGDVYVREPSGSGYWASISVSFSQTHCVLTIPVSFDITRVEGGV